MGKEMENIIQTDKEFSDYSREFGAAEAFFEYADEESIMLSKNSEPVEGRIKIKESMAGLENALLTWVPEDGRVSKSGDLGYTWGRFELSYENSDGEKELRVGKYVSIWKKQKDKKWKWIVDIGNTDDPK